MAFPMLEPKIDISVSKLLGVKTFANFLRVRFQRTWSWKKVLVSENLVSKKVSLLVSENLVLEKSLGFGKFSLKKKSQFWFQVSENLVLEKKTSK